MKLIRKNILATTILSMTAAAALVACGGGGDTPAAAVKPDASVDPIITASTTVAANIGATVIAGATSDEEVYNLAADIGDTWQLILNNKTNT